MASDDSSAARPAPVVLRIKLRYEDVDAMVHRFAPNVGKSGLFLPTKSVQQVGAEIKFELRLSNDTPVLVGLGRVKAVKEPDPANPKAAFGMAIELMRVTRESRDLILKMLERRRQMGLAEVAIPMPGDIEAARRTEVDTGVKDTATVAVPAPMPIVDSGPESLLTSPRRQSGPIAVAKLAAAVAPLAPEGPRRKRMAISEIIESASGPISAVQISVPGLDDDVDIAAVLARARTLAGGSMDAELEALLEVAAAPLEISIEAASAELARQLGGAAVNRSDRSARWARPPSTISTPSPAEAISEPEPVAAAEPADAPAAEQPLPAGAATAEGSGYVAVSMTMSGSISVADSAAAHEPAPIPAFIAATTQVDEEEESTPVQMIAPATADQIITEPRHAALEPPMISDEADPDAFGEPEPAPDDLNEVDPDQIADEVHQLSEDDFEEVEHTQLGDMPVDPAAFDQQAFVTEAGVGQEILAQRLDAHLAAAEADDFGMGTIDRPLDEPAESAEPGAELAGDAESEPLDDEPEEVDDFEILAEADADDADLLAAHGEQDNRDRVVPEDLGRPSDSDFASRLDLYTPLPTEAPREFSGRHASLSELDPPVGELDPRIVSAGHALAAFDDPDDQPHERAASQFDEPASYAPPETDGLDGDSGYTFAGDMPAPSIEFDSAHADFAMPHEFDQSDVIDPALLAASHPPVYNEPYILRGPPPATAPPAEDPYDLETALEALDVDLDDLSIPHAPTELARERSPSAAVRQTGSVRVTAPPSRQSGPARVTRLPRATTEDGIEIDFDDDDA